MQSAYLKKMTDLELLDRIKQRSDNDALSILYQRYEPLMSKQYYVLISKIYGFSHNDYMQDAFLVMTESIKKLDVSEIWNPDSFVFGMWFKKALFFLNKKLWSNCNFTTADLEEVSNRVSQDTSFYRAVENEVDLYKTLKTLNPSAKKVLYLLIEEGLDQKAIAKKMKIAGAKVASLLYSVKYKIEEVFPFDFRLFKGRSEKFLLDWNKIL